MHFCYPQSHQQSSVLKAQGLGRKRKERLKSERLPTDIVTQTQGEKKVCVCVEEGLQGHLYWPDVKTLNVTRIHREEQLR